LLVGWTAKLDVAVTVDQLLHQVEVSTLQRTWRDARRWLFERMEIHHAEQSAR
jgi:hypothetical protein